MHITQREPIMKFGFTQEEEDAIKTALTQTKEDEEMPENNKKKNSVMNLLGFCFAFTVVILIGYLLINLATSMMQAK